MQFNWILLFAFLPVNWQKLSNTISKSKNIISKVIICLNETMVGTNLPPKTVFMLLCVLSYLSHVRLFATLRTVARQALLFMWFSRQEYWSGLPCPSTGNFPHPGIKPRSPASSALQADSLPLSHQGSTPLISRSLPALLIAVPGSWLQRL